MNELGLFLQGIAQLVREGVIAKRLAAWIVKKVLRENGLMPDAQKPSAEKKK